MIEHGMSSIESRDQMFFRGPPRACPHIRETEIFRDIMTSFQPRRRWSISHRKEEKFMKCMFSRRINKVKLILFLLQDE